MVEIHCGILCSCLATLRPLFRKVFPWMNQSGLARSDAAGYDASRGRAGALGSAALTSRRRGRAGSEQPWEDDRRPSFGSAEALKGGGAVELTTWADGGDKASAAERYAGADGGESGGPEQPEPTTPGDTPSKPLRIYVRQTIVSKEVRSKDEPRA